MTGTPFDDLSGTELMLRERFEAAVGELSPDIGRLVADGTAAGRGAVRRRRVASGLAAAAVAIVAVGSIAYATQNDLLGKGDHATDNGEIVQLEPATPRGLAAALLSHTEALGVPIAVGGSRYVAENNTYLDLSGQVAYDLGNGDGVELDVYASTDMSDVDQAPCDLGADTATVTACRPFTLPDGHSAVYVEFGSNLRDGGGAQGATSGVAVIRDDQVVAVVQTMSGTTEFILDQSELTEIAADPAIGMSTTPDFNAAGQEIEGFKAGGLVTSDNGNSSGSATASPPVVETEPAAPGGSGDVSSAPSN